MYDGGAVAWVSLYCGRIVLARLLLRLRVVGEVVAGSTLDFGSFCSSISEEAGIAIVQFE